MAGSADLFGWVTSSAQELEGGRALLRPPGPGCVPVASFLTDLIVSSYLLQRNFYEFYSLQLSATDISAQAPMKGAAKCDNHCELQNSVNQWILERALHSRDIPGSMPASVLVEPSCRCGLTIVSPLTCVFVCHGCAFGWSEWHMQECSKRAAASATCELVLHFCYRFLRRSNHT